MRKTKKIEIEVYEDQFDSFIDCIYRMKYGNHSSEIVERLFSTIHLDYQHNKEQQAEELLKKVYGWLEADKHSPHARKISTDSWEDFCASEYPISLRSQLQEVLIFLQQQYSEKNLGLHLSARESAERLLFQAILPVSITATLSGLYSMEHRLEYSPSVSIVEDNLHSIIFLVDEKEIVTATFSHTQNKREVPSTETDTRLFTEKTTICFDKLKSWITIEVVNDSYPIQYKYIAHWHMQQMSSGHTIMDVESPGLFEKIAKKMSMPPQEVALRAYLGGYEEGMQLSEFIECLVDRYSKREKKANSMELKISLVEDFLNRFDKNVRNVSTTFKYTFVGYLLALLGLLHSEDEHLDSKNKSTYKNYLKDSVKNIIRMK